MSCCGRKMPWGMGAASIPTVIAYALFVLGCAAMAVFGHPQCAAEEQVPSTRQQAEMLLGWVVGLLLAGLCGIRLSAAVNVEIEGKQECQAPGNWLQRSRGVRAYVTRFHLRTLLLHLAPCVLLPLLMSIVPERICLTSEIRVLFIGAIFTACKFQSVSCKRARAWFLHVGRLVSFVPRWWASCRRPSQVL